MDPARVNLLDVLGICRSGSVLFRTQLETPAPGVGKTTWAEMHFENHCLVSNDEFLVDSEGKYKWTPELFKEAQTKVLAKAKNLVEKGMPVVNHNTNARLSMMIPFVKICAEQQKYKYKIRFVIMKETCPDVCFKRCAHTGAGLTLEKVAGFCDSVKKLLVTVPTIASILEEELRQACARELKDLTAITRSMMSAELSETDLPEIELAYNVALSISEQDKKYIQDSLKDERNKKALLLMLTKSQGSINDERVMDSLKKLQFK